MLAPFVVAGLVLTCVPLALLYIFVWPKWQRAWIVRKPLPAAWLAILNTQVPFYPKLAPALQSQLQDLIKVFIHHKTFIGCAGLEITDAMKVVIAAQACLLLLNRRSYEYANVRYIYVYPSGFRVTREVRDEIGLVSTRSRDLLGEAWRNGKVILAWDQVTRGVTNFNDGHNLVLHEFAHQLDNESGGADGAPLLYTRAAYKSWAHVFGEEFARLQRADPDQPGVLDRYGATNPAEFFAVATETFFETPHRMYAYHRELFEQLMAYYQLDPRAWH